MKMTKERAIEILTTDAERASIFEVAEAVDLAVDALKKQIDRKWIPCSERLPKRNELVLVSFETGEVQLCEYVDDRTSDSWFSLIDDCYVWNKTIKAWMPLPERYREEASE